MGIKYTKHTYIIIFAIVCLCSLGFISNSASAMSPYEIESPFDSGSRWYVCQGYDNQGGTHTGTSRLSLDLSGGQNCGNAGSNANVRAPLSGVVSWYVEPSGSMCITATGGGRSIMLTHIDPVVTSGTRVVAGQIVGRVAPPFQRQNNGAAHLHIQAWAKGNCSPAGDNVPFAKANNMKICGAPDMHLSGPNVPRVGMWGGATFLARNCAPDPAPTVAGSNAIYRFWSPLYNHHFFTSSYDEMKSVYDSYDESTWKYEKYAFYTPTQTQAQAVPVYRFWSDQYKGHFYTSSEAERQAVIANYPVNVWRQEGTGYYAYTQQNEASSRVPVFRFWSDQYKGHFYTSSEAERQAVIANYPTNIWRYEGVAFWSSPTE